VIRVARGDEPEALRIERRRRRALCQLIARGLRTGSMDLEDGYQSATEALRHAQGPFCAYCEDELRKTGLPLDHFRPKAAVRDRAQRKVADGYWWLTWSWENLLRACGTCNDQQHKGNQFPLHDDTERLGVMEAPPGRERALLIDPTREDPMDLIEFRIQGRDVDGNDQWKPFPRRGRTQAEAQRALQTIEVFGLDRGDILKFYTAHLKSFARSVRAVQDGIAREDAASIADEWHELTGAAFGRHIRFKALAWDYLRHTFDDATRARWSLPLPRPGAELGAHASIDASRPSELDELLWMEIEALGRSSPDATSICALLLRVVALAPRTTEQLAAWFCREEGTVEAHLRTLRADGAIAREDDCWCVPAPTVE